MRAGAAGGRPIAGRPDDPRAPQAITSCLTHFSVMRAAGKWSSPVADAYCRLPTPRSFRS